MSEEAPDTRPGRIGWQELTVDDAEQVRTSTWRLRAGGAAADMGGYDDYVMLSPDWRVGGWRGGSCSGGECADSGAVMVYIMWRTSMQRGAVRSLGGEVVDGPRELGEGRFCVIRDPAGRCAVD